MKPKPRELFRRRRRKRRSGLEEEFDGQKLQLHTTLARQNYLSEGKSFHTSSRCVSDVKMVTYLVTRLLRKALVQALEQQREEDYTVKRISCLFPGMLP